MRCAKISCKPSATEAKWRGNILLLMQICTAAIYVLAFGSNSNLVILRTIKKKGTFYLSVHGFLSANELRKKCGRGGARAGERELISWQLTVAEASTERMWWDLTESGSVLRYGISRSRGAPRAPRGLHTDGRGLGASAAQRGRWRHLPPPSSSSSPPMCGSEDRCCRWSTSLSKEHVLWHVCKNLTGHPPDRCEEKNKSPLKREENESALAHC